MNPDYVTDYNEALEAFENRNFETEDRIHDAFFKNPESGNIHALFLTHHLNLYTGVAVYRMTVFDNWNSLDGRNEAMVTLKYDNPRDASTAYRLQHTHMKKTFDAMRKLKFL